MLSRIYVIISIEGFRNFPDLLKDTTQRLQWVSNKHTSSLGSELLSALYKIKRSKNTLNCHFQEVWRVPRGNLLTQNDTGMHLLISLSQCVNHPQAFQVPHEHVYLSTLKGQSNLLSSKSTTSLQYYSTITQCLLSFLSENDFPGLLPEKHWTLRVDSPVTKDFPIWRRYEIPRDFLGSTKPWSTKHDYQSCFVCAAWRP